MADEETGMDLVKGTKSRLEILEETPVGKGGIDPQNFAQMKLWAEEVAASGLAPAGIKTGSQVMIAVQAGMELGFSMQSSLSAIAVVNGRPTLMGEAAIALIRAHPRCNYFRHGSRLATEEEALAGEGPIVGWCISKRDGGVEERTEFSWGDAKVARLDEPMKWKNNKSIPNRDSPWVKYPKRMVAWRAVGFHVKDFWSDISHGMTLSEEARDIRTPERDVTPVSADEPPTKPDPLFAAAPVEGILEAEATKVSEQLDDRQGFDGPTDAEPVVEEGAGGSAPPVSSGEEYDPDTGEVIPDDVGSRG